MTVTADQTTTQQDVENEEYTVPVYDGYGDLVAEVAYNAILDRWDGYHRTCGAPGRHKGLTQLDTGEYVLIHGTQWDGERDHAEIITPEQAVREIIASGNTDLFNRYPELAAIRRKTLRREMRRD